MPTYHTSATTELAEAATVAGVLPDPAGNFAWEITLLAQAPAHGWYSPPCLTVTRPERRFRDALDSAEAEANRLLPIAGGWLANGWSVVAL